MGRRRFGVASAEASLSRSRARASSRFRACPRASWATAVIRGPARSVTRRFCSSLSARDAATSKTASTREAVTFACCPPGPEERLARSSISASGTDTSAVTIIGSSNPAAILGTVHAATPQAGSLEELLAPLRADPGASAVFCDIDGTLAPIAERAEDAAVPEETREALGALTGTYRLVGCLSGRRAAEARRLVALDELAYVGNHGFERLLPGGSAPQLDPALKGHEDDAAAFLEHLDFAELASAGLRIEDKGPIRALHWRGADDEETAEAKAREIATDAVGRNLVPHWGRKVLEIRPAVHLDKGIALAELLEEQGVANALYGGDDRTDIDAFRHLRELRTVGALDAAVCVGISSEEGPAELNEAADTLVDGPEGFLAVLRLLGEGG